MTSDNTIMKLFLSISSILTFILININVAHAQPQAPDKPHYDTPDLVIGLIVDQMRPDYI